MTGNSKHHLNKKNEGKKKSNSIHHLKHASMPPYRDKKLPFQKFKNNALKA